jgi:hypothetical protein
MAQQVAFFARILSSSDFRSFSTTETAQLQEPAIFILKTIILPRQARDKHRKLRHCLLKENAFLTKSFSFRRCPTQVAPSCIACTTRTQVLSRRMARWCRRALRCAIVLRLLVRLLRTTLQAIELRSLRRLHASILLASNTEVRS